MCRYIPTLEDDFADNRVIVTLRQEYSDVNKEIDTNSLACFIMATEVAIVFKN